MNLFVVGWNLPATLTSSALSSLRRLATVYPQLEPATLWHAEPHPAVFAACMSTSREAAAPRRYVAEDERHLAVYDGCLIDREGLFAAHDAAELLSHWERLPDRLEGQFAAFRIGKTAPAIEMLTDPLGFEQVYFFRSADTWIVSNSVGVIAHTVDAGGLDVRGASQLLSMGYVGGDRTLRAGIRVVPPGQLWRWLPGGGAPEKRTYCGRAELSPAKRPRTNSSRARADPLRPVALSRLADDLVGACQILARAYGELHCGLTAGRDSRLIAALLLKAGIPARYHTSGAPGSEDIETATRIAAQVGARHEIEIVTDAEVIASWERCSRDLIRQNDGMVNLLQVVDLVSQPVRIERLKLSLWGVGVSVARGANSDPGVPIRCRTWKRMKDFIADRQVDDHGGLMGRAVGREARALIEEFAEEIAGEGWSPFDFPSFLAMYDRQRRWGGANARKAMPCGERFSPFTTRTFHRAALALPPARRYSEPLHYGLMRILAPDLARIPFAGRQWRPQHPALTLAQWLAQKAGVRAAGLWRGRALGQARTARTASVGTFDHFVWLEAKRAWWQSLCLDQKTSPVWDLVDRRRFEHLAAPNTPASERRRRMRGLYNLITLFCYEAECRS